MVERSGSTRDDGSCGTDRPHDAVRSRRGGPAFLLAGCAIAALMCGQAARAQQAPAKAAGNTVELETIDVQGQPKAGTAYQDATGPVQGFTAARSTAGTKTGTPIVDTPASVSVVGQPQIQATGSQTLPEALRYTPGIFANQFGFTPSTDFLQIRGFNVQDVGYYLDGLQLYSYAFAAFQVEPWGLERFDVLRGPASSLYGGSGPGGIIDSISKRPTTVPYHRVEVGVNNFGNAYGAFDLSGPVSPGSAWSYRVAALGRGGGTQVDHFDADRGFVAPSLSYRPDGTTTLTFLGQYQRDFTDPNQFLPYNGTVRAAPFGRIPTDLFTGDTALSTFERQQAFLGYEFEHSFANNLTVRQNLRYSYVDVLDRGPIGSGYADGTGASAQLARFNFLARDRGREVTVDNQLQANADTFALQHTFLGGVDYKHFIINDNQAFDFLPPALNIFAPRYGQVTTASTGYYGRSTNTQDQLGFYGQDQIRFNDLNVVLSARDDLLDTSLNNHLVPANNTEVGSNHITGRVAAIYDAAFDLHPYAGYATSFNPVLGTNFSTQQLLRPEDGEQEEVGVKYGRTGGPILATLALFNLTRSNVLNPDPANPLLQVQTGEERSRGIELGLNATLAEGLSAVGSFTAFSIQNTKDTDRTILDKVPVATPEMLSSLFVDYTIPEGALRGLGFVAGERYVGASYADALNTQRVPDFWLTDAGIHYDRDGYRIAINARNLFDRTYVSSCNTSTSCFYGDRRTILGTLSYTW